MFCAIFVLLLLAPAESLEIVSGPYHNCVFERAQGTMKCWGWSNYGQLGYGDTNDRGDEAGEMGSDLPFLNIGTGFTVEAMKVGYQHSCAMSDDRAMKCFGSNADSQLGLDGVTTTGDALPFLEFGVDFNVSKIAAGKYHTCALSTDAALKCFGRNNYGQCGAGTSTSPISGPPSQINAIDFGTSFTPVDVQTFYHHVCVLSQQQTLKCFGRNAYGQLGYGDTTDRGRTPASMGDGLPIVDLGSDFMVEAIATGRWHTCALSTTKTVKCWGDNGSGQCGTPNSTETGDNLPVLEFGADFVPMQLALGGYHTCILSETATLICFGRNIEGQLGIASTTDVDTPSTLTGIDLGSDFVPRRVAAGGYHTCAVSTDDDIQCWGDNRYGQLGLGHMNNMGDDSNEMGDNLPIVDVAWPAPPTASPTTASPTSPAPTTSAPTTASPTTVSPTSQQPTESPSTASPTITSPTPSPSTASPSRQPTNVPTTELPAAERSSTLSPTTTRSPTTPPVTVLTAADATTTTTTTTTLVTSTATETTASSSSTIVIIVACASALFITAVCICAAAFYYVRKNDVRADRRLSENVAKAQLEEQAQQAQEEIGNDAYILNARQDATRREYIELAIAEVRVGPGVFAAHERENEDTRGEDNLSLPAQESVLRADEGVVLARNQERRQSQQQQHEGDTATLQTAVPTSGATQPPELIQALECTSGT